ncbi:MAG: 4'-phosphopantetheinyl transferase family protein [Odoribacter splanchnicus]
MLKIYYLRISDFQHLSEDELFPLVGEDTVRKVTGYKNPGVRRTKLLGEGMIRRLLFRLWGLHKEDYLIRIGEHGKPLVESRFTVWYNLSHSGDYIVAAFSHLEVGIDIEQKRKARMEVARRFFHPAEIQCLQNLAGDAQDELFFRYWSVKESFLKYTGSGLSSPLSGFESADGHRPHISVRKPSKSLYLCLSGRSRIQMFRLCRDYRRARDLSIPRPGSLPAG